MVAPKSRNWCFTLSMKEACPEITEHMKYIVIGKEISSETKYEHYQGFVIFKNAVRMDTVKKAIGDTAHVEICKGSAEDNINYCTKDGDFVEYGDRPKGQGKRSDLENIAKLIKEKKTIKEIFEEHPGSTIRYGRGIERIMRLYDEKRDWVMDFRIYYGESGQGKTRAVYDEFGIDRVYKKNSTSKFWEGYNGEHCVLIDDFNPRSSIFKYNDLLTLTDRYPEILDIKGTSAQFRSKVIIITTNVNPDEWYDGMYNDDGLGALRRRVTEIRNF